LPELALVLATYNEAENLPPLVEALEESGEDLHLVVVDDDSPDGTGRIAQQLSEQFGNITVVSRPSRLGLGSALQTGLATALDTRAQYVMTMDADRSHDPADVPRLLMAMKAGGCDMVQGSRYAVGGGVRNWDAKRRLLSRVANLTYRWTAGAPKESTTNFRVFSRNAAKAVLSRAKGNGYEFMAESTLLVMAAGFKIEEVPIVFTGRLSGESKLDKGQVLKGIFLCGANVLRYRLHLGRFSRRSASDVPVLD
jgi:dolichol-phosphate mannosyltransferase